VAPGRRVRRHTDAPHERRVVFAMVGRTRLYQRTGSPLIGGFSMRKRRRAWPWVVLALLIIVGAVVYMFFIR
jgi:hypothetical protein